MHCSDTFATHAAKLGSSSCFSPDEKQLLLNSQPCPKLLWTGWVRHCTLRNLLLFERSLGMIFSESSLCCIKSQSTPLSEARQNNDSQIDFEFLPRHFWTFCVIMRLGIFCLPFYYKWHLNLVLRAYHVFSVVREIYGTSKHPALSLAFPTVLAPTIDHSHLKIGVWNVI